MLRAALYSVTAFVLSVGVLVAAEAKKGGKTDKPYTATVVKVDVARHLIFIKYKNPIGKEVVKALPIQQGVILPNVCTYTVTEQRGKVIGLTPITSPRLVKPVAVALAKPAAIKKPAPKVTVAKNPAALKKPVATKQPAPKVVAARKAAPKVTVAKLGTRPAPKHIVTAKKAAPKVVAVKKAAPKAPAVAAGRAAVQKATRGPGGPDSS